MSEKVMAHLPVPDISEQLSYSFKQFNGKHSPSCKQLNRKPPKLHVSNFNRSHSNSTSAVHLISFKSACGDKEISDDNDSSEFEPALAGETTLLSEMYNKNRLESYYEQCFEEISKIGEGSFGEVFKVRSRDDGQFYAVKISKYLFRNETYRQERIEEVKRYEEFSEHEHCVTLYKAWQQGDRLYMQMELCRCSLDAYVIEKKSISEQMVWSILLDLLLALKSLHDKNLIHLDIKLENILISDDDVCKLGDFGLVIDLNRKNLHLATEGDSRYVAPEVLNGQFTKSADIFSLGIAILELACNLELPSNGPLWQNLRHGIFPYEFQNLLSCDLQTIVKSMMAPNPLERPDVNKLLCYHKLRDIQIRRRSKWSYIRLMKKLVRNLARYLIAKLYNLKNIINRTISFGSHDSNNASFSSKSSNRFTHSTPNVMESKFAPSVINSAPGTPRFCNVANSTPLNRFSSLEDDDFGIRSRTKTACRKSRKELSRSRLSYGSQLFIDDDSFSDIKKLRSSSDSDNIIPVSPLVCKNLFFKAEDSD